MPDLWMDVDAALAEVPVNRVPLVDDTDFKTREEAVAYNATGLELIWHFTTTAGATTATVVTPTTGGVYDWAHQDGGMYTIEIPASGGGSINNDTEGFGWFTGKATGVLPWAGPVIGFRAAALNNALIDGGDELDVNVTKVGNTTQTARDIGASVLLSSGTGTGQIQLSGGNVTQVTNVGNATLADGAHGGNSTVFTIASLSASGTVSAGEISTTGDVSIGGDFAVTGAITAADGLSLSKTDATTATVNIAGNHSLGPSIRVTNSGGAALVTAAGNVSIGNVTVTGTSALGTVTAASATITGNLTAGNITASGSLTAGTNAVPWNASWDAEVQSETNDALVALGLDHLLSASVTGTDVTDNSIVARLVSASATADWDDYAQTTDSLQAIRDRGDAAWTTGAGGTPPQLLQSTTIATLASQTSFTLTAGSADNDAYNGAIAVITDQSTSTQKAVGTVSDYAGSTKTVTLSADPAVFTMAAGDTIEIIAALGSAGSAPTAAQVRAEIDANSTQLAAIVADTNELQTDWVNGGRLDLILDARASQTTADAIEADTQDLQTQVGTAGAGLTSINLPDQVMNITGNITGSVSGSVGTVTGTVGGVAGTITTLDALDTAQDSQHAQTQSDVGNITVPSAASVADAVLAAGDVDGFTLEETLKVCLAALAGKLSGAATTTITIRAADDSKARITATVDADGNRSAVTIDETG